MPPKLTGVYKFVSGILTQVFTSHWNFQFMSEILPTASVVYWSEFLATDTEVSGSIPGATRFSE